jgi:hypothetical protein
MGRIPREAANLPEPVYSRQNLFPAKICFPPKHGQLVIFPAHLHVAIGLQLHSLSKHGGKKFSSDEKYAILRRKKLFFQFLFLEYELLIKIRWLYLSLMLRWFKPRTNQIYKCKK